MKKTLALLSFLAIFFSGIAQEKYTLSGYVRDAANGEDLYGANVFEVISYKGVSTNFYGFYSLTLPEGTYTIKYSSVGFETMSKKVVLDKNTTLTVELESEAQKVETIVITGKKADQNVDQVQTGTVEIETKTVKEVPALLGEPDVIKTLQLMPGVQGSSEGAGLIVRGSSPDQNLVLLDQATVYNTGHLLDFFSVFNNDAIKDIKLIKGGIPAEYGGRLSSVLDMKMKEGNMKKYQFSGGIGLISARLTAEGPIVKDKASFMASGRISYLGLMVTPILKKSKDEQLRNASIPWFFDFNAKMNWKISEKDRIFASGYFGRDYFAFGSGDDFSVDLPYGNATASFRWNHLFSGKLFMNNTFVFNQYDSKLVAKFQGIGFKFNSGITNYGLKGSLDYYPNDNHNVKIGYDYTLHEFKPGISTFDTGTEEIESDVQKKYGHELGLFIQDETDIGARVKINYGVRFSMFSNTGPYDRNYYTPEGNIDSIDTKGAFENYATYFGAEPRVNLRVKIVEDLSFKAGFNYINQYIHKVSQSTTTLPTEIWVPSSNIVKPEMGLQATAGFFKNWWDNKIETSIEGYYKKMWNQIEYGEKPVPANNAELEDQFTFGTGESYGAEFFVKLKLDKITGWVSYTLSETTRDFKEINDGKIFPHKYDKTHDLSVVLMYKPHERWKLSGTFVYGSGQNTTIAENYYFLDGKFNPVYGDRNSYRLPAYHRMDLGVTYVMLDKKNKYSDFSLSIYNVYNRKNPYFLFDDISGSVAAGEAIQVSTTQVSLFPILPTISWNFKY